MNNSEMTRARALIGKSVATGVVMVGLVFAGNVAAAPADAAGCREETRKVAVWPKSPRAQQVPQFEERSYKVCDGKVVARADRDEAKPARSSSN